MSWPRLEKSDVPADVTLLLEGTYPMVRGGVAGWIDQLIRGLPELRFAVVFLGSREDNYDGILYELPSNIVHLECHYLMQAKDDNSAPAQHEGNPAAFRASDALHDYFRTPQQQDAKEPLCAMARLLGKKNGISHEDFLYSRQAWQQIVNYYRRYYSDPSFVDYFWSVRNMHSPIFLLARIAQQLPPSRCLHAISTGYAGFLGALAHHIHDCPFIVTEHGIYTKERKIDLVEASWIKSHDDVLTHGFRHDTGYIRNLWIRFFSGLGRLAYSAANPITTLYDGNRERQIADGARPERTLVIPNGIRIERFRPLRGQTAANTRPIVVLLGRVTPIKDIKTFIRAMRQLCMQLPEAEGWIVGPDTEDRQYAQECRDLVEQFKLTDKVKFLGFQRTEDIMAQARLVVLTSISEAQPLVVLEAMAAGLPVVCTDVGSCYELVHGAPRTASTQASSSPAKEGAAGLTVPIADPSAMSHAMYSLLSDAKAWQTSRDAGIERVEAQYTEQLMLERYRRMYQETQAEQSVRPTIPKETGDGRHRIRAS
ncbi:GT4 family glycosyltransferase PelF [Vreelandella rituensis]|uniref:DUF3492 domain-containing protein n=1 Tax=Vreelandella rituensis TaxID=2282306 RepID=A0A368U7V7_9GAMM|nr:GT4 family glycosyltransferase PelF [Halomonas rituensis]RCV92507.1 DUF3492 domain-containing protein [Halomonas rituensis]